jgi:hypothetical protein
MQYSEGSFFGTRTAFKYGIGFQINKLRHTFPPKSLGSPRSLEMTSSRFKASLIRSLRPRGRVAFLSPRPESHYRYLADSFVVRVFYIRRHFLWEQD